MGFANWKNIFILLTTSELHLNGNNKKIVEVVMLNRYILYGIETALNKRLYNNIGMMFWQQYCNNDLMTMLERSVGENIIKLFWWKHWKSFHKMFDFNVISTRKSDVNVSPLIIPVT